ncbi:hypothetical protein [Halomonas sp.]|uniref:hypothetical protein n=1 Tax=Halomonas sp. TaxID=1486246 RepID=UPI00384FC8E7
MLGEIMGKQVGKGSRQRDKALNCSTPVSRSPIKDDLATTDAYGVGDLDDYDYEYSDSDSDSDSDRPDDRVK